ncbi:hypothetical protein D3C71_2224070 [compost metagenome]
MAVRASTTTENGSGFAPTDRLRAMANVSSSSKPGTARARDAEEEYDIATSMI